MRPVKTGSWSGCAILAGWLVCPGLVARADENPAERVDVNLFAAAVLAGDGAVVVGDRGRIFLSGDGARTWRSIKSGTDRALAAVSFPDDLHGWAVGQQGIILRTSTGGDAWEPQDSGVDAYLLDVDFFDPLHGFAAGADSAVVATSDGGGTWVNASPGLSMDPREGISLFAVAAIAPGKACVAGDGGRIFTTGDGGQTWTESESPLYDRETMDGRVIYSMVHDAGTIYAAGIDGVFLISTDQGRTWREGDTGFGGPELYGIDMVHGTGLAVGPGGHVLRTLDGGATWGPVEVPERVTRFWLCGVALRKNAGGEIRGLVVGEDGTFGRVGAGHIHW